VDESKVILNQKKEKKKERKSLAVRYNRTDAEHVLDVIYAVHVDGEND
jgi:hypothetical protein